MSTVNYKEKLKQWRNGAIGFLQWLEDVNPQVPGPKGNYVVFQLTDRLRQEILEGLSGKYKTWIISMPRRHGKSALAALVAIWRLCCFSNQNLIMVSNSERQTVSTCFKLASKIIRHTPFLLKLIGEKNLGSLCIEYKDLDNTLTALSQNDRSLYGMKVNLAQISELHASFNDDHFQVLASSIGDSEDGMVIIDSTTGSRLSPLYKLYCLWESGEDKSIHVTHIQYQNLEDALQNSPPWISRAWLKSRSVQMLPALFAQQHLNKWSDSSNALFSEETIQKCIARYGFPVAKEAIPSLIGARKYAAGIGVDRAFGFSLHGDRTVVTCVLKTSLDEAHYWILWQKSIPFSSGSGIKRAIAHCVKDYQVNNTVFESYNSQDLWAWALEQGYPAEILHATMSKQTPGFQELYLIASEGRLHISEACDDLISEMGAFEYTITESGNPSFQHAVGHHDDFIYSLCWAVWSLRETELSDYEVSGISCKAKGAVPEMCFLMHGNLVPFCSQECQSYHQVAGLYKQHQERHPDSEVDIVRFYQKKVKNVGGVVYRW